MVFWRAVSSAVSFLKERSRSTPGFCGGLTVS
jgi:hypothetical protein